MVLTPVIPDPSVKISCRDQNFSHFFYVDLMYVVAVGHACSSGSCVCRRGEITGLSRGRHPRPHPSPAWPFWC